MKTSLFLVLLLLAGVGLTCGQTVVLKDGRVLTPTRLSKRGDELILELPSSSQISVKVELISRIDSPEPPQIRQAVELLLAGDGETAITVVERVVNDQAELREIPGSWWGLAALRLAQALESEGRGLEAQSLAEKIARLEVEPELARAAEVQVAAILLRRGDRQGAARLVDRVLKESRSSLARAGAFVVKGGCLLAEEKWEEAMLSFVHVSVFYPGESAWLPAVLLGRGRALIGMEDFAAARSALEELRASYPKTPEAKTALQELQRLAVLEKQVEVSR